MQEEHPAARHQQRCRDERSLELALTLIRTRMPAALTAHLETTDQELYGFRLRELYDEDGRSLLQRLPDREQDCLLEDLGEHLAHLSWDSVVGEDQHGNALLDIRQELARLTNMGGPSPAVSGPSQADTPPGVLTPTRPSKSATGETL